MPAPVDWRSGPEPHPRPKWAENLTSRGDTYRTQSAIYTRALAEVVQMIATPPCPYGAIGTRTTPLPTSPYPSISPAELAQAEPNTRYIYRSSVITPYAPSPFIADEDFTPSPRDHVNGRHRRWIQADVALDDSTVWDLPDFPASDRSPSPTPSPEPLTPAPSPEPRNDAPKFPFPAHPSPPSPQSGSSSGSRLPSRMTLDLRNRDPSPKLPAPPPSLPAPPVATSALMHLRALSVQHVTSGPRLVPAATLTAGWVADASERGVMVCPTQRLDETAWRALGRLESAHRNFFAEGSSIETRSAIGRFNAEFNNLVDVGSTHPLPAGFGTHHRLLRDAHQRTYLISHRNVVALEQWISNNAHALGLRRWSRRQNRRRHSWSGGWGPGGGGDGGSGGGGWGPRRSSYGSEWSSRSWPTTTRTATTAPRSMRTAALPPRMAPLPPRMAPAPPPPRMRVNTVAGPSQAGSSTGPGTAAYAERYPAPYIWRQSSAP